MLFGPCTGTMGFCTGFGMVGTCFWHRIRFPSLSFQYKCTWIRYTRLL